MSAVRGFLVCVLLAWAMAQGPSSTVTAQGAAVAAPPSTVGLAAHPRDLTFAPLNFVPPERSQYRQVLANKVVAYMVEDHDLPLISLTVHIRGGGYLDPKGKPGVASMTGSQMRAGGAGSYAAEAFDEELDFLAANAATGFGPTAGQASISFLAKDRDRALALFFEMLRSPRFQQDRVDLLKTQQLQAIERRNDATDDIEDREWVRLIRGDGHFTTAQITKASIEAVTRDDLVAFHKAYVHPGNFFIAVSGDFATADMKARLDAYLRDWPVGTIAGPVPKPTHVPVPGLYLVDKPDVNQGRVTLGHLGIDRTNPDEIAVSVMNQILGGGAFTSRITSRVRSDEGLAYSASSSFAPGVYYPGMFTASFQSKSESVARAAAIVREEIDRIQKEPVAAKEIETVKSYLVDVFPRTFASPSAVANLFATDELTGRPAEYWRTYRDRVRAVSAADVSRVAKTYLQPDRLVVLAVGNVAAMLAGDKDHAAFSLEKQAPAGRVTRIPLPDPITMIYPTP